MVAVPGDDVAPGVSDVSILDKKCPDNLLVTVEIEMRREPHNFDFVLHAVAYVGNSREV